MKKENLKYVWLAIFVTMVCTIITCKDEPSAKKSTIEVEKTEEVIEVREEVVEPVEEKIEEVPTEEAPIEEVPVEEAQKEEVPTEETPIEEIPTDWIPPVDTIERKEYYDENNWKYDSTIPQEEEDGQD